jgi:23S rRNA pseudouridine1911/1915/1917 synthase
LKGPTRPASGDSPLPSDPHFGPEPPDVELADLSGWIVHEDASLLVVDKPGWLLCHPSKRGPRSSLVGACREWTGLDRLHLVSRLDRETSGLVVLAKDAAMASRLQKAVQERQVEKIYLAILDGRLEAAVDVDAPLGPHPTSAVRARVAVLLEGGKAAHTRFEPLGPSSWDGLGDGRGTSVGAGHVEAEGLEKANLSLVRVIPSTGRKHQIRAHAAHIGHPVAGDKIYGPDEGLFLEFIEAGWTERMARQLPMQRQALHLAAVGFSATDECPPLRFEASLPADMQRLLRGGRAPAPGS